MAQLLPKCFQEDAARQLEILEKEIQDSTIELGKIIPLHEDQVQKEKDIAMQYVYGYTCFYTLESTVSNLTLLVYVL